MDLRLKGKTAIVSGASMGIGFETARLLSREGVRILITARTEERLMAARDRLAEESGSEVHAYAGDMTTAAGVDSVVSEARARLGEIDMGVANVVGHKIEPEGDEPPPGFFTEVSADKYRIEFRQLVMSVWLLSRALAPQMRERGWGRIVSISSGVARESAWYLPHILPNTVRPAAAGAVRSLAYRYAGTGVTFNNILTGNIATERNRAYMTWLAGERGEPVEKTIRDNCELIPMKRPGLPEEMAAVIGYLCSTAADNVSGQSIHVNGGSHKHIY